MNLAELRSLATLADSGSITRSAEDLHLCPSAIHRQLKLLEEELGVRLYERSHGRLRLTQAAEQLLPLVKEILRTEGSLLAAARDLRELRRGTVRIGAGPTFSSYMLPLLLEDFRKRCPDIEVIVEAGHTTQFQDELDRGALDVAFLVVDQPLPSHVVLEASWEFEIPLVVGAQRACPRRCFLRRLKDQPFILYRQGSLFEGVIDRYFNSFGFQPRVTMRLDNADPIKAMIRSGFGISLLPSWVVTRELREGSIELIRQREQPLKSRIGMMRRRSAYVPHSVRAFLDLARKWDWPWG